MNYYMWHSFSFLNTEFFLSFSLVSVKICTTPKLSITSLARDSNIIACTWRNSHSHYRTPDTYASRHIDTLCYNLYKNTFGKGHLLRY